MPRLLLVGICLAILIAFCPSTDAAPPEVRDPRLKLQLVADAPDIVTPIGATFDHKGRLLVIESHTHHAKADYPGPKSDRIRIVEDTNGDGTADRFRTFYEGTRHTMSLVTGPQNWLYVATRMKVFRIRDTNGDDQADEVQDIAVLDTKGDYPHNGLCGLTFDHEGRLLFGLGENLGAAYKLSGTDGRSLSGGGEGGNIYRCKADGSGLEHLATGLWNPFGICVDPVGRIFTVENDPDATPPCRLLHVVKGGDYGFQFRYGRAGRHPLQAWDGELPGTLPMVAGTGEAPCDVLPYHGQMWVTSWGDYRIERFTLKPVGASFRAEREIVVQGDDQFRPVDFAVAPDGSLYFTDWVDKSYPVHGRGRIWRLSWKEQPPKSEWPALTPAEKAAAINRETVNLEGLRDSDAFARQAAVVGLATKGQPAKHDWSTLLDERVRLGVLEAARLAGVPSADRDRLLTAALNDSSPEVRLLAVRWIADDKATDFRDELEAQLNASVTSVSLFQAVLAAIEWLDVGKVASLGKNPSREFYLLAALENEKSSAAIKAMALRVLPPGTAAVTVERLVALAKSSDKTLQREAVRSLVLATDDRRFDALAAIARDESLNSQLRADALDGLATQAELHRALFESLTKSTAEPVRAVAMARLGLAPAASPEGRPAAEDIPTWLPRLSAAGDADAGWRLFFGPSVGRCANCHTLEGRGASVGPDLTLIGTRMDRRRLVESILQPSREVAPHFVPWVIATKDGRILVGQSLGLTEDAKSERFLGQDGKTIEVKLADIEERVATKRSIMPDGLEKSLSDQQLRDLLSLLQSRNAKP